ncbi:FAD-dependent oxidoreductase [Pseudomonas sp. DY-1]|jgi:flavin-dependent dehydrogenase|uniref:flavin-dependent monooxygenase QhpG n=1 Tax=Pseudomonas sp. DY-1 TaxID=1755504 RepID=UPI000EA85758|nr:tryptophan 7-halogenase [Pseudomonas sp. DY-1]AYF86331.1 FAD-dependent oxidoreductase [Pseudomonas sp. DY-1]
MSEIVVLGAGPAGAAVALGLKRLGYGVRVISEWRRFAAVEGVSQRVLDGLRQAGLQQALACAAAPSPRRVLWNGDGQSINQESLLDRPRFDAAIREDLREAGIEVLEARVLKVESTDDGHLIQIEAGEPLRADFLVEARGRQAPLAGGRLRGPETLSLLNQWQESPGRPGSAVESLRDGWAWMARLEDGRCYWQITLDARDLPPKDQLPDYCAQRRAESTLVRELFGESALHPASLHARSSTAILFHEASGANWLRVGDAAMAVDPLSGNGIFQSLSSALQAPAVINTMLQRPERTDLARRFHQRRVEHLFLRFARTGRDFYALEQRWPDQPFWRDRRIWPDAEPMHAAADFSRVRVARAPVIHDDQIDEAEVVVTADQPLGIWHLQGVELAPIINALRRGDLDRALATLPESQRRMVQGWLLAQGYRP